MLSELAADLEVEAAVPEEVEDPLAAEAPPLEVPEALTAPEDGEPDPVAVAADPEPVAAPVGAGVGVTRAAEERRQLRWQVS